MRDARIASASVAPHFCAAAFFAAFSLWGAALPLLRRNLRACFAFGERALRARLHVPLRVHFCAAAFFAAFS